MRFACETRRMRFAYADPPYPGMAHYYRDHPDYGGEVDHAELVTRLCEDYPDGWALSTASTTLQQVLALCPSDVRIAAWVKPFASFKPGVNPGYCWEPVVFRGGRRRTDKTELTVRDYLAEPITLQKGLTGAKPPTFCTWICDLLGYRDGIDELADLFPGTAVMGRVLAQSRWC